MPGFLFNVIASVIFQNQVWRWVVTTLATYVVIFLLTGIVVYRARRYRLTRTEWRGIRGGMSGSSSTFSWLWMWSGLLVPVTVGWILPWRANRLQAHLGGETTFGNRKFSHSGSSTPLYLPFAMLWIGIGVPIAVIILSVFLGYIGITMMPWFNSLATIVGLFVLAIPVLAVVGAWYRSRAHNLFAAYT